MLESDYSIWLLLLVTVMAVLYSSVGHGGASGYLAAMALFGLSPDIMKPAALTMNIVVSAFVLFRLARAGHFNRRLFYPFAIASIPCAYLGGYIHVTDSLYNYIVGIALLIAALRFLVKIEYDGPVTTPKLSIAFPTGATLGFISGLTGVGGGIYLSPLLLLMRWTTMRTNASIAAAFILVNSVAGLAGHITTSASWPPGIPLLAGVALIGAFIGSELAVRRLSPVMLRKVLGAVLLIAGIKMIQ